jgi:hypothetical protein
MSADSHYPIDLTDEQWDLVHFCCQSAPGAPVDADDRRRFGAAAAPAHPLHPTTSQTGLYLQSSPQKNRQHPKRPRAPIISADSLHSMHS